MILLEDVIGVPFREDILRGVRLFAIVFAVLLCCVAGYRIVHARAEAETALPAEPPPPANPAAAAAADPAPVSGSAPDLHPLVVPAPPPVPGTPAAKKAVRPRNSNAGVPPPPPLAPVMKARRAPTPSGREFEPAETTVLPAAPSEEASETKPLTPNQGVGYKSLLEANPKTLPEDQAAPPPAEGTSGKPKGNRFLRAVGKIFHPGAKKETTPPEPQPKQP